MVLPRSLVWGGVTAAAIALGTAGSHGSGSSAHAAPAASPTPADPCSALTLTPQPGLNPSSDTTAPGLRPAPDIPRDVQPVSLPLYPGATALTSYVAGPYPEYPANPYLQTAGAEYETADGLDTARAWFDRTMPSCGWHHQGTWNTNASAFTRGVEWAANSTPDLNVYLSFGSRPSGGTYLGYGVEQITYPPRPAASYLHGTFTELRIAQKRATMQGSSTVWRTVHVTVSDEQAIKKLVQAINAITDYYSVPGICVGGGLSRVGPAWLSFIRLDGIVVQAYESGPGACGGLAVNGTRWLVDRGAVWNQIQSLVKETGHPPSWPPPLSRYR